MKTQKVEIEVPVFSGMEFIRFGIVSKEEAGDENIKVCAATTNMDGSGYYSFLTSPRYSFGLICMIYKKKNHRKIIYEEFGEDYLKLGDFYRDDDGDVSMWISDMQSREKHPILKKIHDDFEVSNG